LYCFSLPGSGNRGAGAVVATEEEDDDDDGDENDEGKRKKEQPRQVSDAEFAAAVSLERVVPAVSAKAGGAGAAEGDPKAAAAASAATAAAASLAKKHAPSASLAAAPIGVIAHPLTNLSATWAADGELKLWEGQSGGGDVGDGDDDE
jgi:hypothetical protein